MGGAADAEVVARRSNGSNEGPEVATPFTGVFDLGVEDMSLSSRRLLFRFKPEAEFLRVGCMAPR